MAKTIAALAIAALMFTPVTAHADPSSDTVAYKQICGMLESESPDQVVDILMRDHGADLDTAHLMVLTAIDAYCPTVKHPHWDWTH
jgi:hypothetical protein